MSRPEPNVHLREARQQKHWSREALAERLGVSSYTVGRWERGEAEPEAEYVLALCQLFELSPAQLGLPAPASAPVEPSRTIIDPAIPVLPAVPLIGRATELETVRQRLTAGNSAALTALNGLPGVGKTTLATALAYDETIREHFHSGILWASLGPTPNLPGLLAHWGSLLGLTSRQMANFGTIEEWAVALRTVIGERRMLLVIDDAWTVEEALALKVGGSNCAHVLTTRFPHIAAHISIDGTIPLRELSNEQGMDLLRELAPQVIAIEQHKAQDLVQAVGGLPLALTLMGNYLRRQAYTGQSRRINSALQRLSIAQERLKISVPAAPVEAHSSLPGASEISLQSVIAVTDQLLDAQSRTALYALAVFPPKPNSFAEAAALAVANCDTLILDQLNDAGLLESSGSGRYTLHQTIADYAHLHLLPAEADAASSRLVSYVVAYLETHKHDYEQLDLASSTILNALDAAHRLHMQPELIRGVLASTPFLLVRAWYEQAEKHIQRAYTAAQERDDQGAIIDTLHALGELAQKRSNYAQAASSLQEGLALARQLQDQERTCSLLTDLGHVVWKRGDYAQAETYLLEGLALARQIAANERICDLLRTLGSVENGLGNYAQSEDYLREGLELARHLENRELPLTLLLNLGANAGERGNNVQAEAYYLEGLNLARQIGHREAMSILLANLGDALSEQGKYAAAESYFQEGLQLVRQIGHREWTSGLLINLGTMLRKQGRFDQAQTYLQESLDIARAIDRPQMIATALYEYGNVALARHDLASARTTFTAMLQATPAKARDLLALAQYGLARVAAQENQPQEARNLAEQSAATLTAIKHRNAHEVQSWLENLS